MVEKKVLIGMVLLMGVSVVASAAVIEVPYDSETGQYYLSFSGYTDISSGDYDPDSMTGTFQKYSGNDKWVATDWSGGTGTWEYQFTGGPADNLVETVSVNMYFYKTNSAYTYTYTTLNGGNYTYFNTGTGYDTDWYSCGTLGSEEEPLNVDNITVAATIMNGGGYETAIRILGFEITATAVPEPMTMGLISVGLLGIIRRKR